MRKLKTKRGTRYREKEGIPGKYGSTLKRYIPEYVYKEKKREIQGKRKEIFLSSMKYILGAGGLTAPLTAVSQLLPYINALPDLQLMGSLTFSFSVAVVTTAVSIVFICLKNKLMR
ncbi:MAG: hypothetical protein J7L07_12370 [Candidatus Odinarchaeota archaeon]|nr:hypothetical protein [Candidatus Odinarchaeota archaeon]